VRARRNGWLVYSMTLKIPSSVAGLISFLQVDCGMSLHSSTVDSAHFGNTEIVLQGCGLRVCIGRERYQWYVAIGNEHERNHSYDIALLKEQITGQLGEDYLSIEEEAAYVRSLWPEVVALLVTQRSDETAIALEKRWHDRVRRRMAMNFTSLYDDIVNDATKNPSRWHVVVQHGEDPRDGSVESDGGFHVIEISSERRIIVEKLLALGVEVRYFTPRTFTRSERLISWMAHLWDSVVQKLGR
jgi:hypothetical protein